ncbi:MAG: RNA methyltransferase [Tissierellia bacterium]|nr:RNA methyltransferase [Tissierellia bacterium]
MISIDSFDNKRIKQIKSLKQKKYRLKLNRYLLEGIKVINEAVISKKARELYIRFSNENDREIKNIIKNFDHNNSIFILNDKLFDSLTDTINSQGIIAICERNILDIEEILPFGKYILLDRISDPGNLGGIIRSAEAFEFDGAILSPGCVDIYNEKTVRATSASIFRLPIYEMKSRNQIDILKKLKFKIFAADMNGSSMINENELLQNFILIIGNEGQGVGEDFLTKDIKKIHIPMKNSVESLNANVAASIMMFESYRRSIEK